MKKPKTSPPFAYRNMTPEDAAELLNDERPIKLKYNEELVNRVYDRYPLLDKTQISIIITAVFHSLRELLMMGRVLNFNKLFFDCKLLVFGYRTRGKIYPVLKVKISTPPPLKGTQRPRKFKIQ